MDDRITNASGSEPIPPSRPSPITRAPSGEPVMPASAGPIPVLPLDDAVPPSRKFWILGLASLLGVAIIVVILVIALGGGDKQDDDKPKPNERRSGNMVSGKVTLNGQVVSGTVIFAGPATKQTMAPTNEAGAYMIEDPKPGKYKILVRGMSAPPPLRDAAVKFDLPDAPKQGVAPPLKYADPKTSDLTFEVTGGEETFNIELKP